MLNKISEMECSFVNALNCIWINATRRYLQHLTVKATGDKDYYIIYENMTCLSFCKLTWIIP